MADCGVSIPAYCAPASRVLTLLHIPDPDVKPGEEPQPHDGMTKCGLPRLVAELWVCVERKPSDPVCPAFEGRNDEQGMLL